MPRYVAFLRGVSPLNARMPALKECFERAGFTEVTTLLSSGNVVFNSRAVALTTLQRRAEEAMQLGLGRTFDTFVRPAAFLSDLLNADPFAPFQIAPQAKKVVTFLRAPTSEPIDLPPARHGARILKIEGSEVFSVYVANDKGPVFMTLLEKTFGKQITTRTLDTVRKCARA